MLIQPLSKGRFQKNLTSYGMVVLRDIVSKEPIYKCFI
jgi:hypothetical protein